MIHSDFYRRFEDKYRGSRELIRGRLKAYLPFVEPMLEIDEHVSALDLGCGRGEWLELLKDEGFSVTGVDLDASMLAECTKRGLSVVCRDALDFLENTASESVNIISAFHLVEHISFGQVDLLVYHALRVLKPGGLLILETPNPENILVGSNWFYQDPTHVRPLPPTLLKFLPEIHQYVRSLIVRLQEDPDLQNQSEIGILQVLEGVSPDYSVVSQKSAPIEVLEKFDVAFNKKYGIELATLAEKFDANIKTQFSRLFSQLQQSDLMQRFEKAQEAIKGAVQKNSELENCVAGIERAQLESTYRFNELSHRFNERLFQLHEAERRASDCENRLSEVLEFNMAMTERVDSIEHKLANDLYPNRGELAEDEISALQDKIRNLEHQRFELLNSLSWKITAPFRGLQDLIRHPYKFIKNLSRKISTGSAIAFERLIIKIIGYVLERPKLDSNINRFISRYPSIHGRLSQIWVNRNVNDVVSLEATEHQEMAAGVEHLSTQGRAIYKKMKKISNK